jgi:hypothetical protein
MLRKLLAIFFVLILTSPAWAACPTQYLPDGVTPKPVVSVPAGNHYGVINWTNDNVYVLEGFVYIGDGLSGPTHYGELHIEAGTIVKGQPGQAENSKALIITRYSKIFASGTPTCPIVMTALNDDVDNPNDLGPADKGLWGSLIVLGAARINTPGDTNFVEGVPQTQNIVYGGSDENDNSGVLQYISLRHGGTIIGAANEINGLTLGGVGSGTTVDHIEAYANLDDGFEWFGGCVNAKYLVAAFCDDDKFDWDQGFTGKLQYLFAVDDSISNADHLFEMDSDDATFKGRKPYSFPTAYNFTGIGRGKVNPNVGSKQAYTFKFKENTGGHMRNGIVLDYTQWGVEFENQQADTNNFGDCSGGRDSEQRARCLTADTDSVLCGGNPAYAVADIDVYSIIWHNLGKTITNDAKYWTRRLVESQDSAATVQFGQVWPYNVIADPGVSYGANFRLIGSHSLDPRPTAGGPAFTINRVPANSEDPFFDNTNYVGAFDAITNWAEGWTATWFYGHFRCTACGDANSDGGVDISDAVFLISYIFSGGAAPADCNYANGMGDANGDGDIDISDAVHLISYIFSGGSAPHCQ